MDYEIASADVCSQHRNDVLMTVGTTNNTRGMTNNSWGMTNNATGMVKN
ncbi:hypothetical protein [Hanstruepera ponticola]|nr:hypothetical protein [Hanstruepera ponticola]